MKTTIKLNFSPDQLNTILPALSQLRYRQVHELIERIQNRAGTQLLAAVQQQKESVRHEMPLS